MNDMEQLNERMDKIEKKLDAIKSTEDCLIDVLNNNQDVLCKVLTYWKHNYKIENGIKETDRYENIKEQVKLMTLAGVSLSKQAEKLGVTIRTISNWKEKLKQEGQI